MKFSAFVLALAFGGATAFTGLVSRGSPASTTAVRRRVARPINRRDMIKVQSATEKDAIRDYFAGGGEYSPGAAAAVPAPAAPVAVPAAAPAATPAVAVAAAPPAPVLSADCRRMYVHWAYIMCLATSMVNAATLIQFDEVVMHMTGPSTKGPLFLASGLAARGWHNLGTVGAFLFGCLFAGLATSQSDANTPVKETAPWLIMAGSMLFSAGGMASGNEHSCLYIAAAAGGILNGLTSKMTTFRVSHVTGTVTDLGLLIGKGLGASLDAPSALKLRDLGVLMTSWLFGGAFAFWLSNFMAVGKVIMLSSLPVLALGVKGLLKPYAKGPWKL